MRPGLFAYPAAGRFSMFDALLDLFDRDRRRSRPETRGWLDRLGDSGDHNDSSHHQAGRQRPYRDDDLDDGWDDDDRRGRHTGRRRETPDWDD
jgi:hypothetical protein